MADNALDAAVEATFAEYLDAHLHPVMGGPENPTDADDRIFYAKRALVSAIAARACRPLVEAAKDAGQLLEPILCVYEANVGDASAARRALERLRRAIVAAHKERSA